MKKIFLIFSLFIFISLFISANQPCLAEYQTPSKAIMVLETNSKRILKEKNAGVKLPMASTTKIVTAITVLDNCSDLDTKFKIDKRAVGIPGTSIYLEQNEEKTVRELLYGLMLVSGNDAAVALALHISEDIDDFCALMTRTARKAGAYNSSFKNPHGLDEVGHYTTAHDLALITSMALKNDTFKEIVSTKQTTISGNSKQNIRYLKNKNKLLNTYQGATGVKTGFTNKAGRCFVGSAERDGLSLVCVVLNCGPMFEECAKALDLCFEEYDYAQLFPSYNYIRRVKVLNGKEESLRLYTKKAFSYPLTTKELTNIKYVYDIPSEVVAPIKNGDIIGSLKIYLNEKLLFTENVYAMEDIKSVNIIKNIKEIISNWNKSSWHFW